MTDSVMRAASPDGVAFDLVPAGTMPRTAAYFIDLSLQFLGSIVIELILAALKLTGEWASYLAVFVFMQFYMVFFELLLGGKSPGKLILGLQVVRRDGSPITLSGSLLRNLLRAFDFFFGIGLVIPLLNRGFMRLGDMVAGTLVVYEPGRLTRREGRADLKGIEPIPPQRIVSREAADAILSFAERAKGFSPELRKELAEAAAKAYLFETPAEDAEKSVLGIAAWYAGMRPSRKTESA
jgi:uncharacterized RDD family membrane protein YckC